MGRQDRGRARCEVNSKDDLSIAYTPGVAEPCLKIKDDPVPQL